MTWLLFFALRVFSAYVVAIAVAAVVAIVAVTDLLTGASPLQLGVVLHLLRWLFLSVAVIFGYSALLPTVIVGLLSMLVGLRSALWYPVMGAVIGIAAMLTCLALSSSEHLPPLLDFSKPVTVYLVTRMTAAVALGGICGGFVFWIMAGSWRSAGARTPAAQQSA